MTTISEKELTRDMSLYLKLLRIIHPTLHKRNGFDKRKQIALFWGLHVKPYQKRQHSKFHKFDN